MIVMKFWGTSVGSPESIEKVVDIITPETREKVVVLSAFSGVTNSIGWDQLSIIRMISYGGSNYNISLLVKTSDKVEALNALNQSLFQKQLTQLPA